VVANGIDVFLVKTIFLKGLACRILQDTCFLGKGRDKPEQETQI
jgi:hypothetical protein